MGRPKGTPQSEEAKQKIRLAQLGRVRSPETRRKMSEVAKRRDLTKSFHSAESRRKAGDSNKGRKPWHAGQPMPDHFRRAIGDGNRGKPKSVEHRLKMAEARRGEKSHFWRGGVHAEHTRERQRAMRTVEYRVW